MSTITKEFTKEQLIEWAQKHKKRAEEYLVAVPNDEYGLKDLALAEIALASLEAEKERKHHSVIAEQLAHVLSGLDAKDHQRAVISCAIDRLNNVAEILQRSPSALPSPPAPVSVPECFKRLLHHAYGMTMGHDWNKGTMAGHHRTKLCQAVEECRAAMLQAGNHSEQRLDMVGHSSDAQETQVKPVADLYGLTSPTSGETSFTFDAVEARDFIDGGWSCQEYVEIERFQEAVSGNSPVIPDGWALVPVEPTEDMIVNGFESEPDEFFSDEEVWNAYDAMSGCQQAAHRAKLCWAAMIASAPKPEA
ncbi:hypothetical protein [Enterobacter hormaechei]|uniref:hypothetical protein n=1 Tax=Enterobacter hormaechei TaxID=158836 RepID=UPI001CC267EC|nr:hypothetical protein [Enterobacter hormaechei]